MALIEPERFHTELRATSDGVREGNINAPHARPAAGGRHRRGDRHVVTARAADVNEVLIRPTQND